MIVNQLNLSGGLRPLHFGVWLVIGFSVFCSGVSVAQQTKNSGANIQVSSSRKIGDDEPESSKEPPTTSQPTVDSRVKAIHNRIDILKEIIAKKNEESAESKPAEPAPAPEATTAEPSGEKSRIVQPLPIPTQPIAEAPKVKDKQPKPETVENHASESKTKPKANPLEGLEINTSQINSLELANSLFLTQNYAQALKSYEALLIMDATELDTAWLRCLTANCYRVQKQYTKAERLYRDVAGFKEPTFPHDHAQWYLDHISRRSKIESEFALLENELAPFQKEREEKK